MLLFLVYHKVENGIKDDIYSVTRESFVTHLRLVKKSGIKIVDSRCMSARWLDHQDGVIFTFDDGTIDHFETVLPILGEFEIPALFYVPTAKLSRKGYLSEEQVYLLFAEGHTIGSHGHSRKRLDVLPKISLKTELEDSCAIIQGIIGERPLHFAPPGGFYNRQVQQAAQRAGYEFFRTMRWGYNCSFEPMRIEVAPMTNTLNRKFIERTLHGKGERLLKLMYLLKNGLRTMLPASKYSAFRQRVMDKLSGFQSKINFL